MIRRDDASAEINSKWEFLRNLLFDNYLYILVAYIDMIYMFFFYGLHVLFVYHVLSVH